MRIYLVRHGETDWNIERKFQGREDIELNKNGIEQAYLCGQTFKNKKIKVVVTSPLKRAKKTAEIIHEILGTEGVIVEKDLIEREFGQLSGRKFDTIIQYNAFGSDYEMEAFDQMTDRLMKCIRKYANEYQDDIIMVSHGAAINGVLYTVSHGEAGTGKTTLKNTGISILECENGEVKLGAYNLTADEFASL